MCVHLVEVVLEDGLGVGHLQDLVGDPVAALAAVEEVRLHPGGVLGVLHEEVVKVGVTAHPVLHQGPVPAKSKEKQKSMPCSWE